VGSLPFRLIAVPLTRELSCSSLGCRSFSNTDSTLVRRFLCSISTSVSSPPLALTNQFSPLSLSLLPGGELAEAPYCVENPPSSRSQGDSSGGTYRPFRGEGSCLLIRLFARAPGEREKLRRGALVVDDGMTADGGGEGEDEERETERGR
jgi:hypothetical protein